MAVNSVHRAYKDYLPKWARCRDAHDGSDAIKAKGTVYLPLLEGHSNTTANSYLGYLARAMYYPATGRTVAGLAGLVFGKSPTVDNVPENQREDFDDVTLTGVSLGMYAMNLCREILITGRVGTLVDMPAPSDTRPVSILRPYWVTYLAEQIINWQVKRINGKLTLTMVVLLEEEEAPGDDLYEPKYHAQYRVLQLIDGWYTVSVYRQNKDDQTKFDLITGPFNPLRRGERINFIPFSFLGSTGQNVHVEQPPLLDLVDMNLSHYRTSADHEHGAHFTALPTPYVTGHTLKEGETLSVGAGTAWVLPNAAATAGMVEFSGSGLGSLAALKQEKRELMISLGARMLEMQRSYQEAAETVRIRHSGERSALTILAAALGQSLTQAMRWHCWWRSFDTAAAAALVTMNPEIMDELTAEDIKMLVDTWQRGGLSKKTLYYNMQWGEWTRPGVNFDEEEKDIADEKKQPTAQPPTPPAA